MSKSTPARAFARADAYQSDESGAPSKAEKKLPGLALPKIPSLERAHDASTDMGTLDSKLADQISIAAWTSFFAQAGKLV